MSKAPIRTFEDLVVWQKAFALAVELYRLTRDFPTHERYGLSAELRKTARSVVYNIAEVGLGLNPYSRLTGCMLDDEGVLKTLHIGIGTNITLGGNVKAACHYDLLMWNPTVSIDGVVVVEEGELI